MTGFACPVASAVQHPSRYPLYYAVAQREDAAEEAEDTAEQAEDTAEQAEESQRRYPPEAPLTLPEAEARPAPPPRLLTAEEKIAEVAALLQAQRQENHCLQLEMEALRDSASLVERAGAVGAGTLEGKC
ncbi:unnamed protein product [Prorocentrum cordatum]|uniref:Uncharacterized protein n=1 Tax=Prorocentrum cordatum TaxID=2364126 RepID=A0ABN9V0Q9_9DINO|nr:unnamed protein product [Polarella glacialis]